MQNIHARFLPTALVDFFKRSLQELFGLSFVLLTLSVLLSLVSYSPLDPSFNTSAVQEPHNWCGFFGAYCADIFLQLFGLSSFVLLVLFGVWGYRLLIQTNTALSSVRVLAGFMCCLAFGVFLSGLPRLHLYFNLPLLADLPSQGGVLSFLLYWNLKNQFITYHLTLLIKPFLISVFMISFICGWCAVGLSLKEFNRLMLKLYGVTRWISFNIWQFIKHKLGKKDALNKGALNADGTDDLDQSEAHQRVRFETIDEIPEMNWHNADGQEYQEESVASELASSDSSASGLINIVKPSAPKAKPREFVVPEHLLEGDGYVLPPLELLDKMTQKVQAIMPEQLHEQARLLESVLAEFGIRGEIVNIRPGPVVALYELKPAPGIKTSRVIGLADDIARSMCALSARIAVIPGQNVIGIELPNRVRQTVYLRELLNARDYSETKVSLPLILGQDIGGYPVIADLAKMPHLLVAGTTGSGKSVSVNAMILSLLFKLPPEKCKFIMVDPKMLELSVYDDIPHLLTPVVTDPKKAIVALKWAVKEMENRYRAMSRLGVRNIDGFNTRVSEARRTGELLVRRVQTGFDPETGKPIFENQGLDYESLPYIVVVVDEMADLMLVAGKEIEATIQRLAQMARAAGIHLIMATQRPSVDVITGTIKANFPTRISFQVTSKIDSRTILSEMGAEQLLGQGDMLHMAGGGRISRVHGPFVRDEEVERVVAFLKAQGEPAYIDGITDEDEESDSAESSEEKGGDTTYNQAVEVIMREGKVSTSFIQRHLQIGYNRAARIVEQMEKEGLISPANHSGKREILR